MQGFVSANAMRVSRVKPGSQFGDILLIMVSVIFLPGLIQAQTQLSATNKLAVRFEGKYGQVEVGGNFAGAEFHDSRPFPSRISLYYPVANSIDLSTDYWKRGESRLFHVVASVDGATDTVGASPCVYEWVPYEADFHENPGNYRIDYSYRFCNSLPALAVSITFTNNSTVPKKFDVNLAFSTVLRTCQTYAFKDTAIERYAGSAYVAEFPSTDADSTAVFVLNAGESPLGRTKELENAHLAVGPEAVFDYSKFLPPADSAGPAIDSGGNLKIVLLIGSCRINEVGNVLPEVLSGWKDDIADNENRIKNYVYGSADLKVSDSSLEESAMWSKAELASDRHYIDGTVVPMPCPAEYNFFFTHDVLLTDLGAVFFDLERVRRDFSFIKSLTGPDSILPHAYYWRDNGFKTEFATANNWNHLWFMILCGTYLKHSDDTATIGNLYAILKKSVSMTLSNLGPGDVMYSTRPDWWDVGDNYGARAYLTALMVRALREYSYVAVRLGRDVSFAAECLKKSDVLQSRLSEKFWNESAGYLLDTFDTSKVDDHYYAGPLVAVDYGLLDTARARVAVMTAQTRLLDDNIGVRTAMPADFDKLASLYKFKEGEVGAPYVYINGAVWSQTTAWYILALAEIGEVDKAEAALMRYSTLDGIEHSPNGQPSFYEYRFSDPASPSHGRIDKPNFMWAGGWYLNSLYHLIGVRENEWNISVTPHIPVDLRNSEYTLTVEGSSPVLEWTGGGSYFRRITADGKSIPTAVLTGKMKRIDLELGTPDAPYLASASCVVKSVSTVDKSGSISMKIEGLPGQSSTLRVVSPEPVREVIIGGVRKKPRVANVDGVFEIEASFVFDKQAESAYFKF